jgi:hypothetical protein
MVDVRSVEEVEVESYIVAVGKTENDQYEASVVKYQKYTRHNSPVASADSKFTAVGRAIDEYLSDEE